MRPQSNAVRLRHAGRRGILLLAGIAAAVVGRAGEPMAIRVESEVFVDGAEKPVATSLTLFRDGLAWDFLQRSGGEGPAEVTEIVLHDPARERIVVVDPRRNVKTQIDSIRLERLSVSLAAWARKSGDRLICWAGGPDFGDGIQEGDSTLDLVGPRVRYTVDYASAPSPEVAERYRRFADTAILLKALLHPGGIPPFPRLAINRRVATASAIPSRVRLEVDSKAALVGGRSQVLRSVHRVHPRLLTGDFERLDEAEAQIALAEPVDLASYMEPATPAPLRSTATAVAP